MIIAETDRVLIHCFTPTDAEAMLGLHGEPQSLREALGEHAGKCLEACSRASEPVGGNLAYGSWAVVDKETGEVVGNCALRTHDDLGGRAENLLGCHTAVRRRRRGFGAEAAGAIRDRAFGVFGLPRIAALVLGGHDTPQARLTERIGMRYWNEILLAGHAQPAHLYALANDRS